MSESLLSLYERELGVGKFDEVKECMMLVRIYPSLISMDLLDVPAQLVHQCESLSKVKEIALVSIFFYLTSK